MTGNIILSKKILLLWDRGNFYVNYKSLSMISLFSLSMYNRLVEI